VKVDLAIAAVGDAEGDLGKRLRVVAERHAVEHDLYHLGHSLARMSAQRLELLAPHADRYDAALPSPGGETPGMLESLRHKTSELLGRAEPTALLLVRDLLDLYQTAQAAEIRWTVLVQVSAAVRDEGLLRAATDGHQQVELCARWLRTRIKETAPQTYATG
jgi:hypothetical protein